MNSDAVFINQTELYEVLTKFLTNIKKDGSDRKTIDNYKRKAELLEAYWGEYQSNHRKMCEFAEFDHVYFKKSCFETAQEVYKNIKERIEDTVEQLHKKQLLGVSPRQVDPERANPAPGVHTREQPHSELREPDAETEQKQPETLPHRERSPRQEAFHHTPTGSQRQEQLMKKQSINFKAFMRTVSNIDIDSLENKWQFQSALKSLDNRWGQVDQLHWEIEGEDGGDDFRYQSEFSRHEAAYNELTNNIHMKMWSVKHREQSTPQISIPIFNGTYNQWVSFKDLFTEAIDKNPSMSNTQKMQFLKSKVAGEAERLIHHLQISSDNYRVCWEILTHRYDNKKSIFTSYIRRMLELPNVPGQQQYTLMLKSIKSLHDVTNETLHAVQILGVDISTWDPLLVHLLSQKLDNDSHAEYISSIKNPRELPSLYSRAHPSFAEIPNNAIIRGQHCTIHRLMNAKCDMRLCSDSPKKEQANPNTNAYHISRSLTCGLCNADHGLWHCSEFLQTTDEQKLNKVEQLNYCKNCLICHFNKPCVSKKRCRKCLGPHNTLLHEAIDAQGPSTSAETNSVATKKQQSRSSNASWDDLSDVLLATAVVKVVGIDGTLHTLRALIDQGSQISLINEKAAQTLGLKRSNFKGQVFGVGEKGNNTKGQLELTIHSIHSDFSVNTNVIIMNHLLKQLPNKTFQKPLTWSHIKGINLADPEFYTSRSVELLLGADVYSKIILGGILRGDNDRQPIAQQTQLGWLLCGSIRPHYHCNVVLHNTEELLKFWENEDINQKIEMSTDDHECLEYFHKTTTRLDTGTYEVRLPFKPSLKEKLGLTKPQALAQYRNLEKKLEKNGELKEGYQQFMNEYLQLNHMIPSSDNQAIECFLPHHAVTRAESTTTKLRVVFNASAKLSSGFSLNDVLYRGPNIQEDLQELILKWRQFQYVYTADIEKMYRMIRVNEEDQAYQKILWRGPNQRIQPYQLVTLTYGTKPAGFLAMMCLKQLASDERNTFPEASKELEGNFYMDDYCGGRHTMRAASQLKSDLIKLLRLGGFNLRKWTANRAELLTDLEKEQCNQSTYEFKQSDSTKTLGLGWNPKNDHFIFTSMLDANLTTIITKRSLLSNISKLFDPLGWLTPLSTTMKLLFQNVWLSKLKWDEELPEEIKSQWCKLRKDFTEISDIKINRWLGMGHNEKIELHGFCDASNKAYACVIYCKIVKPKHTTITLVAGKARLAPLNKAVSIPRLELMGAHLLSQLMLKVQSCLSDYHKDVYCWTDSTAVLGWIHGDPARWKPFVTNRVATITKTIRAERWLFVKTSDNPADCASRGVTVKQLINHSLWWQGPPWLSSYTKQGSCLSKYETNLEVKPAILKLTNMAVVKHKQNVMTNEIVNYLLNKFSSISKIIRIYAWILRLPTYKKQVHRPYLEIHELRVAKLLIIKTVQQTEFADELEYLNKHGRVQSKSKILTLNPIIDKHGILRVGGRLTNAHISQNSETIQKPPPITSQTSTVKSTKKETNITRTGMGTAFTVLLCVLMLILPTNSLHTIKQLPNNMSLYFDPVTKVQLIRDKWTLVMYYDMEPYWTGVKTYNKITNYLSKQCSIISVPTHCNMIVQQARHDYQEFEYYNELLLTQHFNVPARRWSVPSQTARRRRGLINGVGYLANDLFGVLDSRFADQYVKDIDAIHRNEKHLANLWKNQTSIIEAEFNLMKRMESTVNQQHKLINKRLLDLQDNTSSLKDNVQNMSYVIDFTLSAMAGNNLLQGLRRLQDTLLDTITDIYHGQLSIHLLPPAQLERELQIIYGKMPSELTLPIQNLDTDLQYIYKLLKVKARATSSYVIIEITFPLISRDSFQLYKLIPIPLQTKSNKVKIIPVSEYAAVNLKRDSYFTMTTEEITSCLHHGVTYMCQLLKPVLDLKNDESFCGKDPGTNQCRTEKRNCTNEWINLHLISQHFYFCCDTYTIKIICDDQVTVSHLSRAGVLAVSQECVVKGKDFALYSVRHQSNQFNSSTPLYVPEFDQINHLVNIKIPDEKPIESGNINVSMTSLERSIEELRSSNAEVEDLSPHDIHHYVISYTMILCAVGAIVAWIWRTRRCRPRREPANAQDGERDCQQIIEMIEPPRRRVHHTTSLQQRREPPGASLRPNLDNRPNNSEVINVSEINNQGDIGHQLHRCAKRWPSVNKLNERTDNGHLNDSFTVEDTIV